MNFWQFGKAYILAPFQDILYTKWKRERPALVPNWFSEFMKTNAMCGPWSVTEVTDLVQLQRCLNVQDHTYFTDAPDCSGHRLRECLDRPTGGWMSQAMSQKPRASVWRTSSLRLSPSAYNVFWWMPRKLHTVFYGRMLAKFWVISCVSCAQSLTFCVDTLVKCLKIIVFR